MNSHRCLLTVLIVMAQRWGTGPVDSPAGVAAAPLVFAGDKDTSAATAEDGGIQMQRNRRGKKIECRPHQTRCCAFGSFALGFRI